MVDTLIKHWIVGQANGQALQPARFAIPAQPGGVPTLSAPPALEALGAMPVALTVDRRLDTLAAPVLTTAAVTEGLGLDTTEAGLFQTYLRSIMGQADNEAILRQQVLRYAVDHGYEPALRSALLARSMSCYAHTGKASGTAARIRARARGMTPDSTPRGSDLLKAGGGPFIGPRGGKWADAAHTIPWSDDFTQGQKIAVTVHPRIVNRNMADKTQEYPAWEHTYYVGPPRADGQVQLSRHADGRYGPTMPRESVKHFVNDQAGVVDLPPSGHPDIDAVTSGKAKFLGKGDDGMAFKHGDKVVKVSTTVPYQPDNQGHRSPEADADMMRQQVTVGNHLADLGVPCIQRSEFVKHGDKGFQIKPWVEIPEKFTKDQLEKLQDAVLEMHKRGYALHDEVQAGLDDKGEPVMFDVGKAAPLPEAGKQSREWAIDDDMGHLHRFFQASDVPFVRRDKDEGEQAWQKVHNTIHGDKKVNPGFLAMLAGMAADKRRKRAKAQGAEDNDLTMGTIDGDHAEALAQIHEKHGPLPTTELERAKAVIHPDYHFFLPAHGVDDEVKKAAIYYGPEGGTYSDPEHKHYVDPMAAMTKAPPSVKAMEREIGKTDAKGERLYRVVGITDETSECEHCGKKNLKRVVVMQHKDGGEPVRVGTSCAAKAQGWTEKTPTQQQTRAEKELEETAHAQATAEVDGELRANPLPREFTVEVSPHVIGHKIVAKRGIFSTEILANKHLNHTVQGRTQELHDSIQRNGYAVDSIVRQQLIAQRASKLLREAKNGPPLVDEKGEYIRDARGRVIEGPKRVLSAPTAAAAPRLDVRESFPKQIERTNAGYTHVMDVSGPAFAAAYQRDQNEPLAWNAGRLDKLRALTTPLDSMPHVYADSMGRLAVHDGRHRLALAAERGVTIPVAMHPENVEAVTRQLAKSLAPAHVQTDVVRKEVTELLRAGLSAEDVQTALPHYPADLVRQVLGEA